MQTLWMEIPVRELRKGHRFMFVRPRPDWFAAPPQGPPDWWYFAAFLVVDIESVASEDTDTPTVYTIQTNVTTVTDAAVTDAALSDESADSDRSDTTVVAVYRVTFAYDDVLVMRLSSRSSSAS
jgi:hypothetical protein